MRMSLRSLFLIVAMFAVCFAGLRWLNDNRPWQQYPRSIDSIWYHSDFDAKGNCISLSIHGSGEATYFYAVQDGNGKRQRMLLHKTTISRREAAELILCLRDYFEKNTLMAAQTAAPVCTVALPTGFYIGGAYSNRKIFDRENAIGGSELERRLRLICQKCDPQRWKDG